MLNFYLLFSYGSNSIQQIKNRIESEREIIFYPAYLKNHVRIFCGKSQRWNHGAICSFYPFENRNLYGIAVYLTMDELLKLDTFENGYERIDINIILENEFHECKNAYIYRKINTQFYTMPSDDYLQAIHHMLNDRKKKTQRKLIIRALIKNKIKILKIC